MGSYDFEEVRVARTLTGLSTGGLSLGRIDRVVDRLHESAAPGQRPLADWRLTVEGDRVVVRDGDQRRDPSGQLLIAFEDDASTQLGEETERAVCLPLSSLPAPTAGPDADTLRQAAEELSESNQLELAAEAYRLLLISGAPDAGTPDAEDQFALADVLYRLGDLGAARERLLVCLERDEAYLDARLSLGCVYAELGSWELAAAAFEGVLELMPDCADALIGLADARQELGQPDEAAQLRRRLLVVAPEGPWSDEARASLLRGGETGV
jgi:tetratricopeptide (TPR) repeat protein